MATFRKRGAYQWEAQIRRRGYPAQSRTFETKAEAEAWANMIESEMSRGVWVSRGEAEATTLYEALGRYEADIVSAKKGAEQERYFLGRLKAEDLAKRPLATIRSADIATLRDRWLKSYKPATVLRRLAVLSHLFNVARKEWGMESLSNPVALIRKPQPNNARTRRIAVSEPAPRSDDEATDTARNASNDELERIIAASKSDVLPQLVLLAVETAMRRGELLALLWENVDLKRRVAHLPETKNGNSRDVPLSSRAIEILTQMVPVAEAGASTGFRTGPVFNIRGDAVTKAFERAVGRARQVYVQERIESGQRPDPRYLVDLRFHDLRHEATSRLAVIFPLHELTKITGHKDPRMLMRYYHPRAEDLAKRME